VVAVIGPWNFPIANSFGDCIPALAAGNSVILKPSEVTPLSSLLMAEMMQECGLVQVATGGGSTGAALIAAVEEPACDEFVEKVTDNIRKLRQGAPSGIGTVDVGAVIFPPRPTSSTTMFGMRWPRVRPVLTGGHLRPGAGRFYEPTVLVDVDHSMKCMTEETFGPTLPIMKVKDVEEGVRLANDSAYGRQASVWTSDIPRGESLAHRIEAGVVCVNDAQVNYTALNLPMGGWKASGLGSRHGSGGIRK
jgi:acyl-CoA reductase-like NAD-dependent aldehyde dehydrogenase